MHVQIAPLISNKLPMSKLEETVKHLLMDLSRKIGRQECSLFLLDEGVVFYGATREQVYANATRWTSANRPASRFNAIFVDTRTDAQKPQVQLDYVTGPDYCVHPAESSLYDSLLSMVYGNLWERKI